MLDQRSKQTAEDFIIKIECIFIFFLNHHTRLYHCWLIQSGVTDTKRLHLSNRLAICQERCWLWPSDASGCKELCFWCMHCAPEWNGLTHPHGWRDAPRAGLAVTRPEGAIVPGNRRVELQLMPLLLEGRRMKKDVQCPCSQLVPLAGALCLGALCLLSCLMACRW